MESYSDIPDELIYKMYSLNQSYIMSKMEAKIMPGFEIYKYTEWRIKVYNAD